MPYDELMKLMIEDAKLTQKWREECACCANCRNYYSEYGDDLCKEMDIIPEHVDDIYNGRCNKWR